MKIFGGYEDFVDIFFFGGGGGHNKSRLFWGSISMHFRIKVRNGNFLPGIPDFWGRGWVAVDAGSKPT